MPWSPVSAFPLAAVSNPGREANDATLGPAGPMTALSARSSARVDVRSFTATSRPLDPAQKPQALEPVAGRCRDGSVDVERAADPGGRRLCTPEARQLEDRQVMPVRERRTHPP